MDVQPNFKPMSEISMLTLLIQASAIVKNRNGDPSLHGYVDRQEVTSQNLMRPVGPSKEADFASLDCLSDILVHDTQVLAASYNDATSFTVVMPISNSESDSDLELHPDSFDTDFSLHESVSSATTLKPINATVVPNPNDHGEPRTRSLSGPFGEIQEIESGKSLWIASEEDPLRNDVLK
jgi:hypothetical protein